MHHQAIAALCLLALVRSTQALLAIESWAELVEALGLAPDAPRVVPPEIAQLRELTELRLDGEGITDVAVEMWQLPALRVLSLRDNLLTGIDRRAGAEAKRLEWLDLGGNQIVELDASLFDGENTFACLSELHLDANNLTTLPSSLDSLLMFNTSAFLCEGHSTYGGVSGVSGGGGGGANTSDYDGGEGAGGFSDYDGEEGAGAGVGADTNYYDEGGDEGGDVLASSGISQSLRTKLNLQGNPLSCACRFLKEAGGWYSVGLINFIIGIGNTVCNDASELSGRSVAEVVFISPHRVLKAYSPCQVPRLEALDAASTNASVRSLMVGEPWNIPEDPFKLDFARFHAMHWPVLAQGCRSCAARSWFQDGIMLADDSGVMLPAYQLRYRTSVTDPGTFLCCYSPLMEREQQWTIQGLRPAQSYFVAMRFAHSRFESVSQEGTEQVALGYFSDEIVVRTAETEPAGSPRDVSLRTATERSLVLKWLAIDPDLRSGAIVRYRAKITGEMASGSGNTQSVTTDGDDLGVTVVGLLPGRAYEVVVQGRTAVGWGPLSAPVVLRTKEPCEIGTQRVGEACEPCEITYFGQIGTAGATCTPCPEDRPSTAAPGAVGDSACQTPPGGFFNTQRGAVQQCNGATMECNATGLTERSLVLRPAVWRPTLDSLALLECPVAAFCRGGPSVQGAVWDELEGDQYCSKGHTGAMCSGCVEPLRMRKDGCVNCTASMTTADKSRFGVLATVLAIAPFGPAAWIVIVARKSAGTPPERRNGDKKQGRFSRYQSALGSAKNILSSKVRIIVGFAQVLFQFVVIASALYPSASSSTAAANFVINFDPSALLQAVETGCFFRFGFYDTVIVYTLTPLYALLLMLAALAVVCVAYPRGFRAGAVTLLKLVLQMLFFVYPGVSSALLRVFVTTDLPLDDKPGTTNVMRVLNSDPAIRFDSEMSAAMRVYASVMIAVYPIGVLLFFLFATHRVQVARLAQRLRQDQGTAEGSGDSDAPLLAEAAGFLCEAYRPHRSWFESFELVRKLALTSGFLLIQQYARADSLVLFMLLVVLFLVATAKLQAFVNPLEQTLAELALAVIVLVVAITQLSEATSVLIHSVVAASCVVVLCGVSFAVRDWIRVASPRGPATHDDEDGPASPEPEAYTSNARVVEAKAQEGSGAASEGAHASSIVLDAATSGPGAVPEPETTFLSRV